LCYILKRLDPTKSQEISMLLIWKNFLAKGHFGFVLYLLLVAYSCLQAYTKFGLLAVAIAIFAWFFVVPAIIFLIDHDNRPRTMANLGRILIGR